MEKNQTLIGICSALGANGEGIVKLGENVLFVPGFLPGEKALIRVLKVKGKLVYGKTEEVYTPAEDRVRPVCKVFLKCGGCQLQHMRYRMQLATKTNIVADALRKIGGITYPVPTCEKSDKEYGYRNKLQLPIGKGKEGNVIGFFAERSHRIVPITECPIHPDWVKPLITALEKFMNEQSLEGYSEGQGDLRHIVVRELKNKFLITLVATDRNLNVDGLLALLDEIFPEYSFYLNVNTSESNVIFGDEFILKKGVGFYECTECGIVYEAGPATFVQINDGIRAKLYERAVSFVEQGETVLDCYAGGGLLTALFAKKCERAYGIEVVPEASACAEKLKHRNALEGKMINICGRVEEELSKLLRVEPNATVVLDPPRAGIERSVLKTILAGNVKKLILISCNPATLARDLGILTGTLTETDSGELKKSDGAGAFKIDYLQPFDMFPQSKWVETLVVLSKNA